MLERIKPVEDALDYLRSVYCNPLESTFTRMKAAAIAIEYERPRLAVTAVLGGEDFEARLRRAIERSGKVIEAKPVTDCAPIESAPVNVPHPPAVTDRRFRRA